jgi:bla regulator protein BlaR1
MRMKSVLHTLYGMAAIPLLAFGVAVSMPAHAQILHSSSPLPSFEVVSIRPYNMTPPPPPPPPLLGVGTSPRPSLPTKLAPQEREGAQSTDRVRMTLTVQQLIASAYNLPFGMEGHVEGGPDWVRQESNRYEIQAKIDDSLFAEIQKMPPSQQRDQVQLMEQALLADRFQLKMHFQTRPMPAFALVIAKGGSKLTPSKDGETPRIAMQDNTMTATAIKLDQWVLAPFLGGRTIVNQTGLTGSYDISLRWSELATGNPDFVSDAPDLFTAMQQQLGLKLIPTKAPVEFIVIDHIERPTPN